MTVPKHLSCYEIPQDPGYEIDCVRQCPDADCMFDTYVSPVCASDLGVYEHECEMAKVCEYFWLLLFSNLSMNLD